MRDEILVRFLFSYKEYNAGERATLNRAKAEKLAAMGVVLLPEPPKKEAQKVEAPKEAPKKVEVAPEVEEKATRKRRGFSGFQK